MDFICAKKLKKEFGVEGSFYNVRMNGQVFGCRNYVHVCRKENRTQSSFDAIFVLANPGLCAPKDNDPSQIFVGETSKDFTLAKTDHTQYQIMRAMKLKNWKKVLLINLSDIRAGNLTHFKNELDQAEKAGFDCHSIFSNERKHELKSVMGQCRGPIIIAWGTNPVVRELANEALSVLPKDKTGGMKHRLNPYYYHASPPPKTGKVKWLTWIDRQIC